MRPIGDVYGLPTWNAWQSEPHIDDLSHTKHPSGSHELLEPMPTITSYFQLSEIVAFLAVMNKNLTLLFRGQMSDRPLLPTLHRPSRPGNAGSELDPTARWNQLGARESDVMTALQKIGLPRYRHIQDPGIRYARWAVIQHYEVWPTPMLDFSTSLRVAASFAFGPGRSDRGFLYVTGTRELRSNLMPLRDVEGDKPERADGVLTIRLNSVCPPGASRAHIQEGALMCLYPFTGESSQLTDGLNDFTTRVIARFELRDWGNFWSPPDFGCLTERVLLRTDRLSFELAEAARSDQADGGGPSSEA
ncbi:FRG domain-containing protein [Microbacterium sp. B2969]|uniref:FRG domain-containing protein n=1 Tax=Microbacterium alkaliflavum TaxID=3248839 RepID=A0ABW7Q8P1_9MICO